LTPANQFTVGNDFTNNAAFAPNGGTVFFNGAATSIRGGSTINFNNFTISSGTFTDNSTNKKFNVAGDFTSSGNFIHNGDEVEFDGNSTISGNPTFNNVTISGTLTGPPSLHLQGDFTNNGSFVSGSNAVNFEGSTLQNLKGTSVTDFYNINLTNTYSPVSLSVESTHNLKGVLTLSGGAVFDADGAPSSSAGSGVFTLLSTGDKLTVDASIYILPTADTSPQVIGNVTVQRYMDRAGVDIYYYQVWRDISSPVQNATVADLQKYIPVTGPFAGATDTLTNYASGDPYPIDNSHSSLQRYDETAKGAVGVGWLDFPSASNTETFTPGMGYSVFIFGKDSEGGRGNDLWALRGPINSGTIDLNVTLTKSGSNGAYVPANDGWNLVGNPYPSAIDWASSGWQKSNISSTIYIDNYNWNLDPNSIYYGTSIYSSYNAATGQSTNGGGQYIATGQSFWVKNSNALSTPILKITENAKANKGTQTNFIRQTNNNNNNLIRITLSSASNLRDETVINFNDKASEDFDDYDALKRPNRNGYLNLSSLSPAQDNYAINSIPFPDSQKKIPLDISDVKTGTYTLSFTELESLPASMRIQLEDKFDNTITDLRSNPAYAFAVNTGNGATFGSGRFNIIFGGEEIHTANVVRAYPVPVQETLTIEAQGNESASGDIVNIMGLKIGEINFQSDGSNQIGHYNFGQENSGVYFVRVNQNNRVSVIRIVKE
jgi:hypothetical protein